MAYNQSPEIPQFSKKVHVVSEYVGDNEQCIIKIIFAKANKYCP